MSAPRSGPEREHQERQDQSEDEHRGRRRNCSPAFSGSRGGLHDVFQVLRSADGVLEGGGRSAASTIGAALFRNITLSRCVWDFLGNPSGPRGTSQRVRIHDRNFIPARRNAIPCVPAVQDPGLSGLTGFGVEPQPDGRPQAASPRRVRSVPGPFERNEGLETKCVDAIPFRSRRSGATPIAHNTQASQFRQGTSARLLPSYALSPRRWFGAPDPAGAAGARPQERRGPPERQSRQLGWRSSLARAVGACLLSGDRASRSMHALRRSRSDR